MKEKICCFCGHRDCDSLMREQIKETITDLIENQGITTFYSGGAYRMREYGVRMKKPIVMLSAI